MENDLLNERGFHNGGKFAYVDNPYPCGLFAERELPEIYFRNITIFYGGNGSGKSTLLNLISSKLELNRIAPFNSSEMFDLYVKHCSYELGYDDEGFKHKVPDGSRIITSDDIFDYMLTVRSSNDEISENKETAREQWSNIKYGETVQPMQAAHYRIGCIGPVGKYDGRLFRIHVNIKAGFCISCCRTVGDFIFKLDSTHIIRKKREVNRTNPICQYAAIE